MQKITTIIDKEWAEVFKNPMVLLTVLLLPLIFTALPLIMIYVMSRTSAGSTALTTDLPPQFVQLCGSLPGQQCMQVFLVNQFMIFFMMMPLAIPAAIAAYSIVGEKATRCLEPLLATPITTIELLVGKAAAAAIPAILATWAAFLVFVIGAGLIGGPFVVERILAPHWLLAVLIVGPLMAIAAVNVSVIVSSRVSDPRAAEQISMLVLIPVLAVFFGQLAGLFLLNVNFILLTALVLIVADVALVYLGVGLFQRETILTKWK